MEESNVNFIKINEDEMFEIIIPLDSEKENVIAVSQAEPDLS